MNFQQIEYAMAVDRLNHFGQAAEACNVTQATLSAMIKKLEEELGYTLFDRSRHPVKTTDIGKAWILHAREALLARNSMYELNQSFEGLKGKLRLGIIPTIANSLLPLILPDIMEDHPNLELSITELTTEAILDELKLDQIDLGILATPLYEENIEEHILYYEPMMVYGEHSQDKDFIGGNELKDSNIWLLQEGHCFRNQAMTLCEMEAGSEMNQRLSVQGGSFESLMHLTRSFGGFTLIPELFYRDLPGNEKKRVKPFLPPIPVREISIISRKVHHRQRSIDALTGFIQSKVNPKLSTTKYKKSDLNIIGIQ